MYNNKNSSSDQHDHEHIPMKMSPRISFSNDFVECSSSSLMNMPQPSPPVASDFEFSVSSYSMMSADELFSKGRLLPYKNNHPCSRLKTVTSTLRQELLTTGENDSDNVATSTNVTRPPKGGGSGWWKGLLGLKKSPSASKKANITSSLHTSAFLSHGHPQNMNGNSE